MFDGFLKTALLLATLVKGGALLWLNDLNLQIGSYSNKY